MKNIIIPLLNKKQTNLLLKDFKKSKLKEYSNQERIETNKKILELLNNKINHWQIQNFVL